MPHNGRRYLAQKRKASYVTILNPAIKRGTPPRPLVRSDYIDVPRLSLHGTCQVLDKLDDESIRNVISVYNGLKR
jgi:hypothetical protein